MDQKQVSIDNFDFEGFTKVVLSFLSEDISPDMHPSEAIVSVDDECIDTPVGGASHYGAKGGRSNFREELEGNTLLFFPFSSSNVDDIPVACADGKSRKDGNSSGPDFVIGEVDCVGFHIRLRDGVFYIDSALHSGTMPTVKIQDCGLYDDGMAAFIDRFILR